MTDANLAPLFDDLHTASALIAEGPSAVAATGTPEKPKSPASDQLTIPEIMSEAELAAFLGIAASAVRTKARDGVLIRAGRGRYDVRQSVARYLDQLRQAASRSGGRPPAADTDSYKAAKLEIAKQQAIKLQVSNAAAKGEVIPVADVKREWQAIAIDLRTAIMAIPARLTTELGLDRAAQAALESEIRLALSEIADNG